MSITPGGGVSYFQIQLTGVPAGLDLSNIAYPGWCAQENVNAADGIAIPYSTYGTLPAAYAAAPWDKINYLLNNKARYMISDTGAPSALQLQKAIWKLLGYDGLISSVPDKDTHAKLALQEAALYGAGFVPGPGQFVAVLLDSGGYQDTLIEIPVPRFGAIGDTVWLDVNHNGIQDPGEPGINGVTVRLKDAGGTILATATTAPSGTIQGQYLFTGLPAGNHTVEVDLSSPALAGLSPTTALSGSDRSVDSNTNPSPVPLPTSHSQDLTIDFGFQGPCTGQLGDFVWNDYNRNGIQDPGEPGIPNVSVALYDGGGVLRGTTATNALGAYSFGGVCAGSYQVRVDPATLPAGYTPTTSSAPGSTSANDSNGSPAPVVLPTDSSVDTSIDFGYTQPCTGTIGNFVWHDQNRNGIQDPGEPGIDGITVLLKSGATTVNTAITAAGGAYQFSGVCAGAYTVELSNVPPSFTPTTPNAPGSTTQNDSNGSPAAVTLLTPGSSDDTIDFGFVGACSGSIGDFIWRDLNRNGIQDAGEPGWTGVTVNLRRASDNSLLATAFTGADGKYLFTNQCTGNYSVEVVPPTGYAASPTGQGTTDKDSNPNPAPVTLPTDLASNLTIDFGFYGGAIGDLVWNDTNGNGIQEATEPGLSGWTVRITGANLPPGYLATQTTSAAGGYLFTELPAGTYTVCVTPMAGWNQTYDLDGIATPHCAVRTIAAGITALDVDFGYRQPVTATCVSISAIKNVAITPVTLTGTGGAGAPYYFTATGLPAGITISTAGTISGSPTVTGTFNYTVTVKDKDGNAGTVNCVVTVIAPLTLVCPCGSGQIGSAYASALTAAGGSGSYVFSATGLPTGLVLNPGTGAITGTPTTAGTYTITVKVTDTVTGAFVTLTCTILIVPNNACALTWGFWKNHVSLWPTDTLVLGKQTYNKAELQAILARSVSGDQSVALAHQLIAAKFNVLHGTDAATARGAITTADNLLIQAQGSTSNKLPYQTATFSTLGFQMVLTAGALDYFNADGKAQPGCDDATDGCRGTIGNFVWVDTNRNGIQDLGEPGLAGVVVKLYDHRNNLLKTTTTDANGQYQFTGLCAGTYVVVLCPPSGYSATLSGQGGGTDRDSSQSPASVVLISDNSSNQDLDFGFVRTTCAGKIGSFVWRDVNGNGIQDTGEPGLQGITLSLYSSSGSLLQKSVTDATGYYDFEGLCAATYKVAPTTPPGYTPTVSGAGYDRSKDSNPNPSQVTLATGTSTDMTIDFGYKSVSCTASGFTTYTQGGWGASPRGDNAGALLRANFSRVYPGGTTVIGGSIKLTFTTAVAIQGFLPQGGTPAKLSGSSLVDPVTSRAGTLAGQVLALDLSVDFSNAGVTKPGLANLRLTRGELAGYTVSQVLSIANRVLGGDSTALPYGVSISDLNSILDSINCNFDDGTTNKGYLYY